MEQGYVLLCSLHVVRTELVLPPDDLTADIYVPFLCVSKFPFRQASSSPSVLFLLVSLSSAQTTMRDVVGNKRDSARLLEKNLQRSIAAAGASDLH